MSSKQLAVGLHAPAAVGPQNEVEVSAQLHSIFLPAAPGAAPDCMTIRLADCDGHRNRANMLLSRMYSWRGYGSSQQLPSAPNCMTFTASCEEVLIGTLTLTVDSDAGLAADNTFTDLLEPFRRAPGSRVCELTKFAFDASTPAQPRLAALFHIIFIYGSMHYDCTDLFIEVNPRHRRFYQVMLGFHCVGVPRTNESVDAPAQLMWLNVADVRRHINHHATEVGYSARSLYPHFFSAKEEAGIYGRLAKMADPAIASLSHPKIAPLIEKRHHEMGSDILPVDRSLRALSHQDAP